MYGKMLIALLLTLVCALCNTLEALADPAPVAQQASPQPARPKASPAPGTRSAPSFNCAKALNSVERAICADPVLGELDLRVAAEYKIGISLVADKAALKANQKHWLRLMHSQCANAGFQCIQHYYSTRLSQLVQHNEQAARMQ